MGLAGLLAVLGIALTLSGSSALRIGQLQLPGPIRNGSVTDVVLDCDFYLEPGDKPNGVVVKWFLNRETNPLPVYQWITGQLPQAVGVLKGRLNLAYHATDQPSTRHRALNIINPTIELSGEYSCEVSSLFNGEDSRSGNMTIYVPEDKLELTQSQVDRNGTAEGKPGVRLSCEADGVFPMPKLTFLRNEKDPEAEKATRLEGAEVRVTDRKDGLFDIEADLVVDESTVDEGAFFGCELDIPAANYVLHAWTEVEAISGAAGPSRLSLLTSLAALVALLLAHAPLLP